VKSFAIASSAAGLAFALTLLVGCGGPSGASSLSPLGEVPTERNARVQSDLYVVDNQLRAVVEFDRHGNEIVEKRFSEEKPWDTVADSHGNVYVLTSHRTGPDNYAYGIQEMTHDLRSHIALYSLGSRVSTELVIDADDNLYVDVWDPTKGQEFIAKYASGSTSLEKTFALGNVGAGQVEGLALQRGTLLVVVRGRATGSTTASLWACRLSGSGNCSSKAGLNVMDSCGFTMTHGIVVVGEGGSASPYLKEYLPDRDWHLAYKASLQLPSGLFLNYLTCKLHARGEYVWAGLRTYKDQAPAVAAQFDMVSNTLHAEFGSGHLRVPIAAYAGNGFAP
jgi:hypothetical protein